MVLVSTPNLIDYELTEDRDIGWTETNDISPVQGRDNVRQSAVIDVMNQTSSEVGDILDTDTIQTLLGNIFDSVNNDVQIGDVEEVRIVSINEAENSLRVSVVLYEDKNFELPIQL